MAVEALIGIAHVALKVADIQRSLNFYRDRLGFAEMMRLNDDAGNLWLIYLRITDTQYLELFPGGHGDVAPGPERTAVNHFCLETRDLAATVVSLQAAGVVLTVEPQMGLDHNKQCWFEDPDGNRIEVMQMSPHSMQSEAIRRLNAA